MITESAIYWILKLDDIQLLTVIIAVVALLTSIIFGTGWAVFWDAWRDEDKKRLSICKKCFFVLISVFCVSVLTATFMPTTKQMAMIKVIPAITNSEFAADMSKDAKDLYKMCIEAIKEQLTNKNIGE